MGVDGRYVDVPVVNSGPAVNSATVVDSGRLSVYMCSAKTDYSGGADDAYIARDRGLIRRVKAQARRLAEQRRVAALAEAHAVAMKSQQAADAMAADDAAMRLQREQKLRAASCVAARKNAAQQIARARVAWQRDQTWKIANDAAAIVAEQEAAQRQRLRRRVLSVSTHPSARPWRPASAPAGGRPNPPRAQVPAHEGGAAQLSHSVVRYGSRRIVVVSSGQLSGDGDRPNTPATVRTGFRPSAPRRPPARPGGHRSTAESISAIAEAILSNNPGWVTPLAKRFAHKRALRERANGQKNERPRERPAAAEIASVLSN